MLSIVLKVPDLLFQHGLQYFFADFFARAFNKRVHFDEAFTHDSVSAADIIVLSLCRGEIFICIPELRSRKKGIVIGLVDDALYAPALPACFEDIIFISRNASLEEMERNLLNAWQKAELPGDRSPPYACFDCQHIKLSPQQIRIMANIHKGLSVVQVANKLEVSTKTVFTHKYMVMKKFDLRSDHELIVLLNKLVEKNILPTVFAEYRENDRLDGNAFAC